MNTLGFDLLLATQGKPVVIDGIKFEEAVFIELSVDDMPLRNFKGMGECLVVLSEIEKSLDGSGRYLIFTSASGIADDGGWDGVEVSHSEKGVRWDFEADLNSYIFNFERNQYLSLVRDMKAKIVELESCFNLEPESLFFPEDWNDS